MLASLDSGLEEYRRDVAQRQRRYPRAAPAALEVEGHSGSDEVCAAAGAACPEPVRHGNATGMMMMMLTAMWRLICVIFAAFAALPRFVRGWCTCRRPTSCCGGRSRFFCPKRPRDGQPVPPLGCGDQFAIVVWVLILISVPLVVIWACTNTVVIPQQEYTYAWQAWLFTKDCATTVGGLAWTETVAVVTGMPVHTMCCIMAPAGLLQGLLCGNGKVTNLVQILSGVSNTLMGSYSMFAKETRTLVIHVGLAVHAVGVGLGIKCRNIVAFLFCWEAIEERRVRFRSEMEATATESMVQTGVDAVCQASSQVLQALHKKASESFDSRPEGAVQHAVSYYG